MTWEQWLFEYISLKKREQQDLEHRVELTSSSLKALRDTLIGLLGLNVYGEKTPEEKKEDKEKGRDPDMPRFMPLALMVGDPEWIKHIQETADQRRQENSAGGDVDFDKISQAILDQVTGKASDLPGDMIPLLLGDLTEIERNSYWHSIDMQETLTRLGVGTRDGSKAEVAHVKNSPQSFEDAMTSMLSDAELMTAERPTTDRQPIDAQEIARFQAALAPEE